MHTTISKIDNQQGPVNSTWLFVIALPTSNWVGENGYMGIRIIEIILRFLRLGYTSSLLKVTVTEIWSVQCFYDIVVKIMNYGTKLPEFESWLHYLLALITWSKYMVSQSICTFICKMEIIINTTILDCSEIQIINTCIFKSTRPKEHKLLYSYGKTFPILFTTEYLFLALKSYQHTGFKRPTWWLSQ